MIYNRIKDPSISTHEKENLMSSDYLNSYPGNFFYYDSPYDLKGMTYREFLRSRSTMEEKILFEMRTYSRGVINDMLNFPKDERFFDIRLEEISHDKNFVQITEAFRSLGLSGKELLSAVQIASSNCLWSIGAEKVLGHATTGASNEWEKWFKGDVLQEFRNLFGYAEQALGY